MSATLSPPKSEEITLHRIVTPPRFDSSRIVGEMTVTEWLTFLETAKERYDYVYGKVVQVAGASLEHNIIAFDTGVALTLALRRAKLTCRILGSDMKVYINDHLYYFPDLTVVCGTPRTDFEESLRNPIAVVEVLSPSTEHDDRTQKFRDYQQIPSLRHYILIDQYSPAVTHYEKKGNGPWAIVGDHIALPEKLTLTLERRKVSVALSDIYGGVAFADESPSA